VQLCDACLVLRALLPNEFNPCAVSRLLCRVPGRAQAILALAAGYVQLAQAVSSDRLPCAPVLSWAGAHDEFARPCDVRRKACPDWCVNATQRGGGVGDLAGAQVALLDEVAVMVCHCRWLKLSSKLMIVDDAPQVCLS
jgi:hypothetical protein